MQSAEPKIETRADFGRLLAHRGRLRSACEVGVAEGRYSLEILQWGMTHLYLVDLWAQVSEARGCLSDSDATHEDRLDGCCERVRDYPGQVTFLRGWSHTMAERILDDSLDFLHLDATHEREAVIQDLEAYWPKVRSGGIISGHDYNDLYTVKEGVDEFAAAHGVVPIAIDTERGVNQENACFWFYKP